MPTGYTAAVGDGKVTDFAAFAMTCARAFGALIELRDSPEAEIPDAFTPSPYHAEAFERAKAEVRELDAIDIDDAERRAARDYDGNMKALNDSQREREEKRRRYQAMLEHVNGWTPPTKDHVGLRDFMRQQLEESIRFDCSHADDGRWIPKRLTGEQWLKERRKIANENQEYHRKALADEQERALERTGWVKDLRRSLSEATAEPPTR